MAAFLFGTFYAAKVGAGYLVEIIFAVLHLTPHTRNASVLDPHVTLNYTSMLNIVFLVIAAALVWRFLRTGGPMMLKIMNQDPKKHDAHAHH
jgi:hypothetical protein